MRPIAACRHAFLLVALFGFPVAGAEWPSWRGPQGTGVTSEKGLPLKWSTTDNVRWHAALPGPGNGSPIVWGNRVFVPQAVKGENRRTVMCFDAAAGKLLWQAGVTYTEREPTQQSNPYCAATPATDGERVVASFGSAGLYCYDFEGKELWHRDLGKMNHMFGNASSPILSGDLCILSFGPDEKARLIAVNKRTGEAAWEVAPPKVDPGEQGPRGGPGRGGFGPGTFVAPQMISQGDKNGDMKLSAEELTSLADAWYDKLDPEKAGKLSQEKFTEKLADILPPPEGFGPPGEGPQEGGGRRGGRRPGGFGPGRFAGPGLFTALDANKDGSLTRDEMKSTFARWSTEWDKDKAGTIDEDKLAEGLNAALPAPQFGGPGGGDGPGGRGGPGGPGGRRGGGFGGGATWSTPIVIPVDGREQLIMSFPNRLVAYEPGTGKEIWSSKGLGGTIYTSTLWGDGALVAMSSDMGGGSAIAVAPGGSGDVSETKRLWRVDRVKSSIGSGVIHDGRVYLISQDGIAQCLDLKSGQKVWEERLKGAGSRGGSWSSMLLSDGKIYVPNQAGDVFVLKAGPRFELIATNSVGESTNASIAASGGALFLRTNDGLWCFAGAK